MEKLLIIFSIRRRVLFCVGLLIFSLPLFAEKNLEIYYFGSSNDKTEIKFANVEMAIDSLFKVLKLECGIEVGFELFNRGEMEFNEEIKFPLRAHTEKVNDESISFIYDQYSLYKEFSRLGVVKEKNQIFLIKSEKLGKISLTGAPRKVCGYANPLVQFDESVSLKIQELVGNTIVFNGDQTGCDQNFNSVIAHELAHLLVQDKSPHHITDDLFLDYAVPNTNLLSYGGGNKLSRIYQCPKIQKTLNDMGVVVNE